MKILALTFSLCACFAQGQQYRSRSFRQVSQGDNSPNVSNVSGNVSITYAATCVVETSAQFKSTVDLPSSFVGGTGWPLFKNSVGILGDSQIATVTAVTTDSASLFKSSTGLPSSLDNHIIRGGTDFMASLFKNGGGIPLDSQLASTPAIATDSPSLFKSPTGLVSSLDSLIIRDNRDFMASLFKNAGGIPADSQLAALSPIATDSTWLFKSPTGLVAPSDGHILGDSNKDIAGSWFKNLVGLSGDSQIVAFTGVATDSAPLSKSLSDPTRGIQIFDSVRPASSFLANSSSNGTVFDWPSFTKSGEISGSAITGTEYRLMSQSTSDITGNAHIFLDRRLTSSITVTKLGGSSDLTIAGPDYISLSKSLSDLAASGQILTGWTISYRAADQR
jgi:hypothetical protein